MSRSRVVLRRASAVSLVVLASAMPSSAIRAQSATDKAAKAVERAADKTSKTADKVRSIFDRKKKGGADSSTAAPGGAPAPAAAPAAGGGGGAPPSTAVQRGSAKVEELLVAPDENGITYAITERGGHFAAMVPKGSRFAVTFDGVTGPAFDRLIQPVNGGSFSFSPDGSRFAYIGEADGQYVFMVDGKPVLKLPVGTQTGVTPMMRLFFSPNGKHWLAHFSSPSAGANDPNPSRTWWDGVAGPPLAQSDIVLSPDGERHAYSMLSTVSGGHVLVVDGKPAPTLGGNPVFTADGRQLFTTRDASPKVGSPVTELLLDGRPVARATNVSVHVPPVGDRVVFIVGRSDQQGAGDKFALVVGGKLLPGSEATGYPFLTFSPDGQRFAAISGVKGARQRVLVDGTLGRMYDRIDSLWFTPDSRHVVYTATSGTKQFVITDEVEVEASFAIHIPIVPSFTKEGRVGWLASTGQRNAVVVDGKVTPLDPRLASGDFSFSPDGKRFAYQVAREASGQLGGTVHVDHAPGPPSSLRDFEQMRNKDPVKYIWSPDGRFTVNYAFPGATYGTDFGFVVGDRYMPVGNMPRVALPTFTPDAKHFFWLGYDGRTQMRQLWLDGRVIYEFDAQGSEPLKAPGGWLMGDDGVLTFFIQTVEGFKRVRVAPGAENGFDAWLAKGRVLR